MKKIKIYIKYIIINILLTLFKFLWIIPLNEKRILFFSFGGKQYSDSPKYIYETWISSDVENEIFWAFKEPKKYCDYLKTSPSVKIIKYMSLDFLLVFFTSKVIITNDFIATFLPIKKNQILLNTWHGGSPLKTVGLLQENVTLYDELFFKIHSKKYSAFLSSSSFMTNEVFKKSFSYSGEILEFGMPRNAILLKEHNEIIEKVYRYFGINRDSNIRIVLYAPTFRGFTSSASFLTEEQQFSTEKILTTLNKKFKKKFIFLFRAHHTMDIKLSSKNSLDATNYPDMQELLCASDILITDYSSCMGDMSLMRKPVFLYTPDLEEYTRDRGFYWSIYSLPFPIAKREKDFITEINKFDYTKYNKDVENYLLELCSFENEFSTQKTMEWIKKNMEEGKNEKDRF